MSAQFSRPAKWGLAPSLDELAALAQSAFDDLPEAFRTRAGEMIFLVAEFPDDDVLDSLGLEDSFELLGLFEGRGITEREAVAATGALANRITLFRRPILNFWAEGEETLNAIVTHVLVHEIGHHFGLSDEDMAEIEARAE